LQLRAYDGVGMPIAKHFEGQAVFGANKVSAFTQNEHGIVFAATDEGLLCFDGERWTRIPGFDDWNINSLLVDSQGRIWLSRFDDVGYLESKNGKDWHFHSVKASFPEKAQELDDWHLSCEGSKGYIYLCGTGGVLGWHESEEVQFWEQDSFIFQVFELNRELYAISHSPVLLRLERDGRVVSLEHAAGVNGVTQVRSSALFEGDRAIMASPEHGLLVWDGKEFKSFGAEPELWNDYKPELVKVLQSGRLLVMTRSQGLLYLDETGKLIGHLKHLKGELLNHLDSIYIDELGAVWLGHPSGIFRLDLDGPISLYNYNQGLEGQIQDLCEYEGRLYIGTDKRLHVLNPKCQSGDAPIRNVTGVPNAYSLIATESGLLIGSREGLFFLQSGTVNKLCSFDSSFLAQDPLDKNHFFSASYRGFYEVYRDEDTGMFLEPTQIHTKDHFYGVSFDSQGRAWLRMGVGRAGLFQADTRTIRIYGTEDGLPDEWINLYQVDGQLLAATSQGYFYFSDFEDAWKSTTNFDNTEYELFYQDFSSYLKSNDGVIWINTSLTNHHLIQHPGLFFKAGLRSLDSGRDSRATALEQTSNGDYWAANSGGLLRWDAGRKLTRSSWRPRVYIRSIVSVDTGEVEFLGLDGRDPDLNRIAQMDSFRIQLGTNDYQRISENEYRIMMEGLQKEWPWFAPESEREYTRLSFGDYMLHIEARNSAGNRTGIRVYSFSIPTPWYLRPWAFFVYVLIFLVVLRLFMLWRSAALRRHNRELEGLVAERTEKIQEQSECLEERNGQLKEALEQAEDLAEQAQEAARAKSFFLANMSHEIRTPMNGVMGMCTLLADTSLTLTQRDFVNTIRNSSESLLTIINDILDFSKIEAGKLDIEEIPFNLIELIEDVLDLMAVHAHKKGLEILYRMDEQVKVNRIGDPTRLRQVLVNLVSNAIKFTEKGEVLIRILEGDEDKDLVFEIVDSGIGIKPDRLEQLFQPFSQEDVSTARRFGGTGLGLAICKMLIELMGGRIWANSIPGQGSKFCFTFHPEINSKAPDKGYDIACLKRHHALIVDDSDTNRLILKLQLEKWKMQSVEAASVKEAIRVLAADQERQIEVILLDYNMPEADGVELVRHMNAHDDFADVKVVILSSAAQGNTIELKNLGVDFVLSKPVRQRQLHDALAYIFGGEDFVEQNQQEPSLQEGLNKQVKLLLAEDNPVNQKVALLLLKRLGYSADLAGNGLEAVESVRRQCYDIVLMDVQMPEMDGLTATQEIRKEVSGDHQPLILAMTAGVTEYDRTQAMRVGMDGFIQKPVKVAELKRAMDEAVEKVEKRKASEGEKDAT